MHNDKQRLSQAITKEKWEVIATALISTDTGIRENGRSTKKLRTKAEFVKKIFSNYLKNPEKNGKLDASYLVGATKTIEKLEREYEKHKIKENEFLVLLRLILYKFRQEKLTVKKQMEMRSEFQKMKEAVENENKTLRYPDSDRDKGQ